MKRVLETLGSCGRADIGVVLIFAIILFVVTSL